MSVRKLHASTPGSPPRIDVRNPAGSVTVESVEGADVLDVRVEALDAAAEQLLDRVEIDVSPVDPDRPDSPVRLRIAVPERRLIRTPGFAVRVAAPADAAVRVAVASADVDLRGRLARVDATGASGHIAVDEVGDLELRTASGDVRIGTVHGRASIGSASGDVRVRRAAGALHVRGASGDVSVEHAGGATSISTASGEVTVAEAAGETIKVKTASADVTVGVAPGLRVWLDLATVSGRMTSDLDEDVTDVRGRPQLSLTLRTVSGDLRIGRSAPAPA